MTTQHADAPVADPFPRLSALQAEHSALKSDLWRKPIVGDATKRVIAFLRRAVRTGTRLDDPTERQAAQDIINYWVSHTSATAQESHQSAHPFADPDFDTLLADFDPETVNDSIFAAEAWIQNLLDQDLYIVQQILMRLVQLRPEGETFDAVPAPRGAIHSRVPAPDPKVDELIGQLETRGILRIGRGGNHLNEMVGLRSADLMTRWERLAEWLRDRTRFRSEAIEWKNFHATVPTKGWAYYINSTADLCGRRLSKFGRSIYKRLNPWMAWIRRKLGLAQPTDLLLESRRLELAENYHDKNTVERKFTLESRYRDQLNRDKNRGLMGCLGVILIACAVGWALTVVSVVSWRLEASVAKNNLIIANKNLDIAKENLAMAGSRRSQAARQHVLLEQANDELADVLDVVRKQPEDVRRRLADEQTLALWDNKLQAIREHQNKLKTFQDFSQPLRPGCRVWTRSAEGVVSICSVCCIARLAGGIDQRRFAVVYCDPADREGGIVRRTEDGPDIGRLHDPIMLLRGPGKGTELKGAPNERAFIALLELDDGVLADNRLMIPEILGNPLLEKPPAAAPNQGEPIRLLGGSSGFTTGRFTMVSDSGGVEYTPKPTLGDAGGPVVNERNELVAIRMRALENGSRGFLMAGWLTEFNLELIP